MKLGIRITSIMVGIGSLGLGKKKEQNRIRIIMENIQGLILQKQLFLHHYRILLYHMKESI